MILGTIIGLGIAVWIMPFIILFDVLHGKYVEHKAKKLGIPPEDVNYWMHVGHDTPNVNKDRKQMSKKIYAYKKDYVSDGTLVAFNRREVISYDQIPNGYYYLDDKGNEHYKN